ncbi:MAG: tetratricopeptide repeat protein [Taibaiella sp.]|nr:tetratricopeptide repeat protein [Taibaiella sp.]
MRLLRLISGCILFPLLLQAQEQKTDFYAQISRAKTDEAKAEAYRHAMAYFNGRNADSLKHYTDSALTYFRAKQSIVGEGLILLQQAITDRADGRVNVASQRLKTVLELFKKFDYKPGIADVLGNIGSVEAAKGNYDEAARLITESLKMEQKLGQKHGLMVGYMNLASIYMQTNDLKAASRYMDQAYAVSKEMPLNDQVIGLYNMRGVLFAYLGMKDSALATFRHNLELSNDTAFIDSRIECLSYLAQYYLDSGDPAKSLQYLKDGIKLAEINNRPEIKSNMLLTLAAVTQDTDVPGTLRALEEALQIAQEMGNRTFMTYVYEAQASYYKQLGRFKEALDATEKKQKINDSLFNLNKTVELASITADFDLQKSNERVRDLEKERDSNAKQRNILLGVSALIAALLGIVLVYYRKVVQLNRELEQHQRKLNDLNMMKDKLFSVIGHDLRGPISNIPQSLDIVEDNTTSTEDKNFLINSLRDQSVAAMEMLDMLLFWGKSLMGGNQLVPVTVNVKEVVKQNIVLKKMVLDQKSITVTDTIPDTLCVHADKTHVDFIVRNLLANAIKYAYRGGNIKVGADTTSRKGFVILSVQDDGVGIPKEQVPTLFFPVHSTPGTANEKGSGIGLMLCKEFAVLNGGNIWAESEPGKGATFHVAFKGLDHEGKD